MKCNISNYFTKNLLNFSPTYIIIRLTLVQPYMNWTYDFTYVRRTRYKSYIFKTSQIYIFSLKNSTSALGKKLLLSWTRTQSKLICIERISLKLAIHAKFFIIENNLLDVPNYKKNWSRLGYHEAVRSFKMVLTIAYSAIVKLFIEIAKVRNNINKRKLPESTRTIFTRQVIEQNYWR